MNDLPTAFALSGGGAWNGVWLASRPSEGTSLRIPISDGLAALLPESQAPAV
jgi:hypothetical protein